MDKIQIGLTIEERDLAVSALQFSSTYAGNPNLAADALATKLDMASLCAPLKSHNYKVINASLHYSIEEAANVWATRGWRVVGVIPSRGSGYADQLILERPIGMTHPDD